MRQTEAALHYFVDPHAEIFGGWNMMSKISQAVKVFMIVPSQDFFFDEGIQIGKVAYHARLLIDPAADGYLENIIVPMAEGIIALTVSVAVLGVRHPIAMQAMRSREQITAREMSLHSLCLTCTSRLSINIHKQIGCLVDPDTVQLSTLQFARQPLPDGNGNVFGRRNGM